MRAAEQSRREQIKQETLLRLIEKTGHLDEQTVKTLFPQPPTSPPHAWSPPVQPDARRGLKVAGTIVLATKWARIW